MRFAPFCLFQRSDGCTDEQILRGSLDALVDAETQGYDAAYIAEHYFSPYCLGSSLPSLATAIAIRTKRIRIGTAVSVIPFHHPLLLASDWATVDVLSEGRLELGLGRGYNWFEFDSLGLDIKENTGRFEEGLDLLRAAWTQERVTAHGRYYQFEETEILPKPIQKPYPPLWYAAQSPDSSPMAAKWGLGVGYSAGPDAQELQRRRMTWVEAAREAGHPDEWIESTLQETPLQKIVWVAETDRQAERECEAIMQAQQAALQKWAFPGHGYPGRTIPQEVMAYRQKVQSGQTYSLLEAGKNNRAVLVGSPRTVVAQMKEMLAEFPFDYMLMYSSLGGPHPDDLKRCWRLFADKVMPHFK
jgi:alkanesulfonate monooxygenase SsuD/methylene tetrahydromethanopterin reductase-like flavin-dependent oxidoreductase (luciferase family)